MSGENEIFYSYFLGPQGEKGELLREAVLEGLKWHLEWRRKNYPSDPSLYRQPVNERKLKEAFREFLRRLEGNIPSFHPRYAAQMLKDPGLPAVLAYFVTMLTNPNNHAYEGGPVTTEMELEVVEDLLRLVGLKGGWGHLASGGSLANMEATWAVRDFYGGQEDRSGKVARRPPGRVVFSMGSHYSWKRLCSILRIDDVEEIPVDAHYRMDLNHLESVLKRGNVMLVMANLGTTGCGAVDPLPEILALRERYGFHLHVDAAYGGYAKTILIDPDGRIRPYDVVAGVMKRETYNSLLAMAHANSVTIDPHKHGLVPYGAGCVLYRDERLRQVILNTAPYTYHVTEKPNLGMISLEGSRPGAAAAACWLTHRVIPLNVTGFGLLLSQCLQTAKRFHERLSELPALRPLTHPDLDIVCFYHRGDGKSLSSMNRETAKIYQQLSIENPRAEFILSKFIVDRATATRILPDLTLDDDHLVTLRAVFIKHWMLLGQSPTYLDRLIEVLRPFGEH